jgi:hypothetical protein
MDLIAILDGVLPFLDGLIQVRNAISFMGFFEDLILCRASIE